MPTSAAPAFPGEWDEYVGTTAIPEDFKSFWDKLMLAADAAPLEYEITSALLPSSPNCDFFELRFTGMRGESFYAKYLRPQNVERPPLVLQFHGYPGASRSWFEQSSFVAEGAAIIALDNPGQGGKSLDSGAYAGPTVVGHLIAGIEGPSEEMYYVRLYQNLRLLARIVKELGQAGEIDSSRVYVNGASQGGAMGMAFCALHPELVRRAALLYPFLSDFRGVWDLDKDEGVYEGLRYYGRWFDPEASHLDEWFGKLAYFDTKNFAPFVSCPVLFGTALEDDVVPPKCQTAVYNLLACEKMRLFYPGLGHVEIQDFDDGIPAFFELDKAVPWERFEDEDLAWSLMLPEGTGPHPTVVQFHDNLVRPRGWHHCQRFLAAGYAVVQIENPKETSADELLELADRVEIVLARICADEHIDEQHLVFFGEGFGGALALLLASRVPAFRVAALNPYPLDALVGKLELSCECLLGTSGMDEYSTAGAREALVTELASTTKLTYKHYPKHAHERINAFENENMSYLIHSLNEYYSERF